MLHQIIKHRYAVLSFPPSDVGGSGFVEAVPCNWLTPKKSHCYWPPYKNPQKVTKCLKDCAEPQEDWTISEARCLKLCADYKTARQKSEEAQFTSDLESQDTDAERQQSRERRKRHYDSDVSCDRNQQDEQKKRKIHTALDMKRPAHVLFMPPPPPHTIMLPVPTKQNSLIPLAPQNQQSPTPLNIASATALPFPSPPKQSTPGTSLLDSSQPCVSPIRSCMPTPTDNRPLTEETGRKLITLVMEVKHDMKALRQQNQHIIDELLKGRSVGSRQVLAVPKLPDGVLLPLQTFDQLSALERRLLRSSEDRVQLVNYLGLIGGLTIKATTVNVLRSLLMNDLARQFSFCGQRGKHGFKSLQLKEVVHDAVRANRLTRSATNADVDSVIMEWLRTACDRDGGRHSRGSTKARNSLNCSNTEDVNNSDI